MEWPGLEGRTEIIRCRGLLSGLILIGRCLYIARAD